MPDLYATNKAPRDAVVRRVAISCVYELHLYMIYACYKYSAKYSPSSQQTYKLRMLLDTNVVQVFESEHRDIEDQYSINMLHEDTKAAFEKNDRLKSISSDIDFVRDSISNVSYNAGDLQKQLRTQTAWKWFWVSMIIILAILVALAPIFKMFNIRYLEDAYLFMSLVFGVILVIIGIVAVARNMRSS
jgi:hypothetical protein